MIPDPVHRAEVEDWQADGKNQKQSNAWRNVFDIATAPVAIRGAHDDAIVSCEISTNVQLSCGKELQACLRTAWVQECDEIEDILVAPAFAHHKHQQHGDFSHASCGC